MTEYWKSQARKFCDFCKCWISDNKASISFHENGKRHQQAVENKLYDIKRRGAKEDKKANLEKKWLEEIEQKAMNDYRKKDLGNNGDITAKVFNQKRAERDAEAESEEADKARRAAQLAALQATMDEPTAGPSKGQMVGPQIEAPVSWLKTVRAKTSGTRWHNEPGARKWHEAKSDEGHIYYWHVETNESRWEAPLEGYVSIREQKREADAISAASAEPVEEVSPLAAEQREFKKNQESFIKDRIKETKSSNTIPSSTTFEFKKSKKSKTEKSSASKISEISTVEGPTQRLQPYGSWQTVQKRVEIEAPVDYQVPQVKEAPQANVTLHSDKLTKFEEKKTPSLGGARPEFSIKPAIVFRKRKINEDHRKNARKREDE